jgi:hypothetical protein
LHLSVSAPSSLATTNDTFTQLVTQTDGSSDYSFIYYTCSSVGGYNSEAITLPASTDYTAAMQEWSGAASSSCTDGTSAPTQTASPALSSVTATSTNNTDLFLTVANNAVGAAFTAPSCCTVLYSSTTGETGGAAYKIQTSTDVTSASWAWTGGSGGESIMAAFKVSGGAVTVVGISKRKKLRKLGAL